MISQDEIAKFQALSKYAVVILVLLRLNRSASSSEIARISGQNFETVRIHLHALENLGFVQRQAYQSWLLTSIARQLCLPLHLQLADGPEVAENPRVADLASSSPAAGQPADAVCRSSAPAEVAENPRVADHQAGSSPAAGLPADSLPAVSWSEVAENPRVFEEVAENPRVFEEVAENPRVSSSTTTAINPPESLGGVVVAPEVAENPRVCDPDLVELLRSHGIGEPARSNLAASRQITAELVDYTVNQLRQRGKFSPALLVHALKHDRLPAGQGTLPLESDPPPEENDPMRITEQNPVFDRFCRALEPYAPRNSETWAHLHHVTACYWSGNTLVFELDNSYSVDWLNGRMRLTFYRLANSAFTRDEPAELEIICTAQG